MGPILLIITILMALVVYKLKSRDTEASIKSKKVDEVETDSKEADEKKVKPKVVVLKPAPGPMALPVIGNMYLLMNYESPFQAFTALSKKWGDMFSLQMGGSKCLVVNSLDSIKKVLNQNGKFFTGRPDFIRFHTLFAGDRNNSLALCDWSTLQTRRRNLARRHFSPKPHTEYFARIDSIATFESIELVETLKHITRTTDKALNIKSLLMTTSMNMFCNYMCSMRFDPEHDLEFRKVVDHFDEIFWEINQGYALDFLPALKPFYKKHLDKLSNWSQEIRSFILSRIVEQRELNSDPDAPQKDFVDGVLKVMQEDKSLDRNTVIFMLEDFLGGHSSVGNLVMMCLAAVARDPEIGKKVRAEIESVTKGKRAVTLTDRKHLPYTEATISEALRYASSPIVPHVASENVNVNGFGVEEGTIVFINNYELNMSDKYWTEPEKFDPSRFLELTKVRVRRNSFCDSGMESDSERNGPLNKSAAVEKEVVSVKKNIPHFFPFSIGKRTCIGQTLVTTMSFTMFANIIQQFDIRAENLKDLVQKPACIALPKDTYNLYVIPRK